MNRREFIEIEWIDSKGAEAIWEYTDELKSLEPAICFTCGYIIEVTEKYVTIVQTISDNQVMGRITIPRACIVLPMNFELKELGK